MEQTTLIFDKEYINKNAFHRYKKPITINKAEIKKIVLPKKDSYGNKGAFKYFIGYISHTGFIPLCIRLPQMNVYTKYFNNGSKCMNLLLRDEVLIEKYNEIWDKIKNLFKKEFDSEPMYNDKYIKTKMNLYNTYGMNFYGNKMPEES